MFAVLVADNFNYMEQGAVYRHGEFREWAHAVAAAHQIVERSLHELYHFGDLSSTLFDAYKCFGVEPFISPVPTGERFSAWEYAKERAAALCGEITNR